MSHSCKSIVFTCMDFRLVDQTRDWLASEGMLGDCDMVSLAGAGKELLDGSDGAKELLLRQIATSQKLHAISQIVLLHHGDCGAYKSAYSFASAMEEKARQMEDLARIEAILAEKFPDLRVIKVWADVKDGAADEVVFEKYSSFKRAK